MTKLPTERALARMLRETHEAYTHPDGGGEFVALCHVFLGTRGEAEGWELRVANIEDDRIQEYGREYVPGDECPCTKPGARCRACLHYETSLERAVARYAHCPSCSRGAHWLPVANYCTFDALAAARRMLAAARDAGFQ